MKKNVKAPTTDKYYQLYLRALADYQNLEKRSQEIVQNQLNALIIPFLQQLVEIKQDLSKAEIFHQDKGLQLVKSKFDNLLQKFQIQEIDPLHQEFSPTTMECLQTETGQKDNIVTKVLEKGYLYKNELLKPAKVVVSKLTVVSPMAELKK